MDNYFVTTLDRNRAILYTINHIVIVKQKVEEYDSSARELYNKVISLGLKESDFIILFRPSDLYLHYVHIYEDEYIFRGIPLDQEEMMFKYYNLSNIHNLGARFFVQVKTLEHELLVKTLLG